MRASTNVYLYFGFDFHAKPYTLPEFLQGQDRGGWETYYALQKGVSDKSGHMTYDGSRLRYKKGTSEFVMTRPAYEEFWDARCKLATDAGCDIGWHGGSDYPIHFVHLFAHKFSAWRGHPAEIDPKKLIITPAEIQKLKDFCEVMGIQWREPRWFLASQG